MGGLTRFCQRLGVESQFGGPVMLVMHIKHQHDKQLKGNVSVERRMCQVEEPYRRPAHSPKRYPRLDLIK